MAFRFRKSVRVVPGVQLNLSKGGLSTSVGRSGATVNLSKNGARGTVGIPGSGLSYSTKLGRGRSAKRAEGAGAAVAEHPATEHRTPTVGSTTSTMVCFAFSLIAATVAAQSVLGWIGWFVTLMVYGVFMSTLGQHSGRTAEPGAMMQTSDDPDQRDRPGGVAGA